VTTRRAGRYSGLPRESWVVRPSARALERRATWAVRAGATGAASEHALSARGGERVGAAIWQTPGGVVAELERINSDFVVFGAEFDAFLQSRGYPSTVATSLRPVVTLYELTWLPLSKQWREFFGKHSSWWGNVWWNHAPEAEQFHGQLAEVRKRALELGVPLNSPEPTLFSPSLLFDPRHNVWDDAAKGAKSGLADVWKVLKVALYAGVAIAGGYAILTLARTAKGREASR
jgi:hypothetical protein